MKNKEKDKKYEEWVKQLNIFYPDNNKEKEKKKIDELYKKIKEKYLKMKGGK